MTASSSVVSERSWIDAVLARAFPDLRNHESPLFLKTAEIFKSIVAEDPRSIHSPETLLSAVLVANAQIGAETWRTIGWVN